jgi:hypothetical protein
MANSALLPSNYKGKIYPVGSNFRFPEQQYPVYNPNNRAFGVCFSGGGARAMSAALGQMRGLFSIDTYNNIGAISCVSGGCWFGTIFTYATSGIDDNTLLGPIIMPGDLTVSGLQSINQNCIGYPITQMYNAPVLETLGALYAIYELGYLPLNRLWSRMLDILMLTNFNIDSTYTFFSLNSDTVSKIIQQNPSLTPSNFYTMRQNRPFFISGATQNYPVGGQNLVMRHFEYTAMYSGTPQVFPNPVGPNGEHFGSGYVDNFIFDSGMPTKPDSNNLVSIQRSSSDQLFLLSDQMGSSSSAPGTELDFLLGNDGWFPDFYYWSPKYAGQENSVLYSFTDGGNLENTGIVPLLRRQFPAVIAFVNTPYPLGYVDEYNCVDGVDAQITRLFGHYPPNNPLMFPVPPTQIFNDNGKFQGLVNGLNAAKAKGGQVMYYDTYTIYPNNYFGIPAYPGNGEVMVVWVYNDTDKSWVSQLPGTPSNNVKGLLASKDPTNYMANFPNYATVGQNKAYEAGIWVPEVLPLTAQQVNLLANMHTYGIVGDEFNKAMKSILGK